VYVYRATVSAPAHDGDTLTLDIDLGFGVWLRGQAVRLAGIDTPEINSRDAAIRTRALAARDRVRALCPLGLEVTLTSLRYDSREKYGRILGSVQLPDGSDLARTLLTEGHARAYTGR